jgi:HD-GYP domain-containing protein (c-di-GMP phosphodiesterase class II)
MEPSSLSAQEKIGASERRPALAGFAARLPYLWVAALLLALAPALYLLLAAPAAAPALFWILEVLALVLLAALAVLTVLVLREALRRTEAEIEDFHRTADNLVEAFDQTLESWARALEADEDAPPQGQNPTVELVLALARRMGVDEAQMVHIRRGSLLHDIGRMAVPDAILHKPGPLTPDEWVVMRKHPAYAREMLERIPYLVSAMEIPYSHHERWDGSGYPLGLKGEEIPLPARIFAVVDVWQALSTPRPYRPAWTREQVIGYIQANSGSHFDPRVVENFLKLIG